MKGKPIDHDALHRVLFERTNRRNLIELRQRSLAEEYDWNVGHVGRILKQMVEDGRLRVVSVGLHSMNTYEVIDPLVWEARRNGSPVPEEVTHKRVVQWG
mgnify:FL=1